ncbi:MAG: SpoIID/LytB domain-containing protein [Sedimentisphaerales bacterium]|nr:SpoIID/LytB domain-containing protein [Sedimentisphaerales bacterium]
MFCFLAAPAVVLCGCDQSDHGGGSIDRSARVVHPALPAATVRVSLFIGDCVSVGCEGGGVGFWNRRGSVCYLALDAGESCVVRLRDDCWQIESPDGHLWGEVPLGESAALDVRSSDGGYVCVGESEQQRYRGQLRLLADESGDAIRVVNILDLESYLQGVVGAEAYASWHMAALRAQSVASRSYALWRINRRGGAGEWDLGSNQASQMYRGVAGETVRVTTAVQDTRGVVLTYGGSGSDAVLPGYFSSTCGGHTADAQGAFGGIEESQVPLRGGVCDYCRRAAPEGLMNWGTVEIGKAELSEALLRRYDDLAYLERIVDVAVTRQSDCGRVEELGLLGSTGARTRICAERFRLGVTSTERPLRSSWYRLEDGGDVWRFADGRGYGHGVGMCQWGCQAMAVLGYDCVAILRYYYPGANLERAY